MAKTSICHVLTLLLTVTARDVLSQRHVELSNTNTFDSGAGAGAGGLQQCHAGELSLTLFNKSYANVTGAYCLDGSPAGYYIHRNESSNDWVVFLEGGGLCVEAIDCWVRALGDHGTSTVWAQCTNGTNTFDADARNPFVGINRVWVRYCSGDTWSGTSDTPNPLLGDLITAGHLIVKAVLDSLLLDQGMATGDKLLLTGGSAGGIGTMINADFVSENTPDSLQVRMQLLSARTHTRTHTRTRRQHHCTHTRRRRSKHTK